MINFSDFEKIDIRVGAILEAINFENAKKPAYKLKIDFGDLGVKKSSAQITGLYKTEDLIWKQIIAVVNFSPKQIANFMSECLVLGVYKGENVVLLGVDENVENWAKIC